jgi:GT2 family glycosyltransferase
MMKASVIIPTYRRSAEVVSHTIQSIFSDQESRDHLIRLILIDQNPIPLEFPAEISEIGIYKVSAQSEVVETPERIIHLTGLSPSVTQAKNSGVRWVKGEVIVFFDDDVTVKKGCISNYLGIFESNPEAGYLGGREILDPVLNFKREGRFKRILRALAQLGSEPEYQVNGQYVGRIKRNSLMIKNFDIETDRMVRIDGARGCNWACRKESFFQAGQFDEAFCGTALREETDLYLRLNAIGARGFYTAKSVVLHHRQAGGCENLSASIRSIRSKFENEVYFQKKNFEYVSKWFFAIRTLPLAVENLKESRGVSLLIWIQSLFRV